MSTRSWLAAILLAFASPCLADSSAVWNLNPTSGNWNTAANWTPATVPGGVTGTARFGVSNVTQVSNSSFVAIGTISFSREASAFTITGTPSNGISFVGQGIVNDSGVVQNFVVAADQAGGAGTIVFTESSRAGRMAQFTCNAPTSVGTGLPVIAFEISANAGSAIFDNLGGVTSGAIGGQTDFFDQCSAANATLVNEGALVTGAIGGMTYFVLRADAGHAVITSKGSAVGGGGGGGTVFESTAKGADATLIAEGGNNGGGGGTIQFWDSSDGGLAKVRVSGNGNLDISKHSAAPIRIGSLEGDGPVYLGSKRLTVGNNNLSTIYSGTMQDGGTNGGAGGSLTKSGSGSLTLGGNNTYTGGTTVSAGSLLVNGTTGSGAVNVDAGTLGGGGTMTGAVTIGTGSGGGAFLAPAGGTKIQATLTLQSGLTFNAGATYTYTFKARKKKAKSDKVIANGVTINSGASIALSGQSKGALTPGLTLTLIRNTSVNPINGTFANLPDGGIVTINGNNFQANYGGGDGNDLTLTVVQ